MSRLFRFVLLLVGAGALIAVARHMSRRRDEQPGHREHGRACRNRPSHRISPSPRPRHARGSDLTMNRSRPRVKRRCSERVRRVDGQPTPLRRNREFLLLQAGQLLSSFGNQVSYIAYPLLVFERA